MTQDVPTAPTWVRWRSRPPGCRRGRNGRARRRSGSRSLTALIAPLAVQFHAEPAAAALGRGDPGPLGPGRLVPDVLRVSALQFGHPVPLVIPVVAHDPAPHHPSLVRDEQCSAATPARRARSKSCPACGSRLVTPWFMDRISGGRSLGDEEPRPRQGNEPSPESKWAPPGDAASPRPGPQESSYCSISSWRPSGV